MVLGVTVLPRCTFPHPSALGTSIAVLAPRPGSHVYCYVLRWVLALSLSAEPVSDDHRFTLNERVPSEWRPGP